MNPIKRAITWSLAKIGLELRRASRHDASAGDRLVDFLRVLHGHGFAPKTIYDIGANRGNWTAKVLGVFPTADYLLFEPQAHLGNDIARVTANRPNVQWRRCAVSDACGTAEFSQFEWDVCSRLSAELEPQWRANAKTVTVETVTVDEEVRRRSGAVPELLKIDAEGHDFRVLDGAKSVLGQTELVLVEAAVNCPSMDNTVRTVVQRMWNEGYSLAGIVDLNEFHVPGQSFAGILWLADLAFCRTNGQLLPKLQEPDSQPPKLAA